MMCVSICSYLFLVLIIQLCVTSLMKKLKSAAWLKSFQKQISEPVKPIFDKFSFSRALTFSWLMPNKKYDLWHDRAAFHFLRKEDQVMSYINLTSNSLNQSANMILATFSSIGPEKCSGLEVTRYDVNDGL